MLTRPRRTTRRPLARCQLCAGARAWLGAWSWELITPLLGRAGHEVVTMDLPVEDGTASVDDYADVVCGALERKHEDVLRAGHSYGGNTIPLVAHRRPVRQRVSRLVLVPARTHCSAGKIVRRISPPPASPPRRYRGR
ncbi:alpha/beta fold hydrolase [Mycobacterium simiae]|uniref:alpha/beta fold hydrolase n=1 Tax=Mycobacterium simiae TaxID=1784 RepID=UPI0034A07552